MKKPNIILAGHACIDQNMSEHATYTGWGGTVLYAAHYYQDSYGLHPHVLTRYGVDFLPFSKEFALYPSTPQEQKTQLNGNMPHGHGRIFRTYYAENSGPLELDDHAKKLITEADLVMIGTLLSNYPPSFMRKVAELARPGCLKILGAQGCFRRIDDEGIVRPHEFAEADGIAPLFDAIVFSQEDHPQAIERAKEWAKRHASVYFVITDGPNGATLVHGREVIHIPTIPVPPEEIVDSVGCGDVFVAAFGYSLLVHGDAIQAVKDAHKEARKKLFAVVAEDRERP